MTSRGYPLERSGPPCSCDDMFHDGKCGKTTRDKHHTMCSPCGAGWHWPEHCPEFVRKTFWHLDTTCDRCGWDSSEHPYNDRRLVVDSRMPRPEGVLPIGTLEEYKALTRADKRV